LRVAESGAHPNRETTMRVLLLTIALFFALTGGAALYFASADPGHEYDLKFVLPIDVSRMPMTAPAPKVTGSAAGESSAPAQHGRAETPDALSEPDKLIADDAFKFPPQTEGPAAQ
jgi:hypothetical protein